MNDSTARRPRAWWHRDLQPEERRRVMDELALTRRDGWTLRFGVMLALSVIVATMGLSADSAAVVIGAMLLAPLMTPVLGLAAAIAMALPGKVTTSSIRVALATAGCIALTYAISKILPDEQLADEVLSRTSPDLRDLVVAVAAGVAGAYATVRKDVSAALPGVAVAVALVPPLAAVGVTLEAGRTDLAGGALLLYGTNLAAIVLAGLAVFLVTGFVPHRRIMHATPGVVAGIAVAAAVFIAVAIPLVKASVASARTAQRNQAVNEVVARWADGYDLSIDAVVVGDSRLSVRTSGPDRPPDQMLLEEALRGLLGGETLVSVQWTRTVPATTTTTVAPSTTLLSEHERRVNELTGFVADWLGELGDQGTYELEALALVDDALRVDIIGTGEPPPVEDLVEAVEAELGESLAVTLTWIPRSVLVPGQNDPSETEIRRTEILAVLSEFAADRDLRVDAFEFQHIENGPDRVVVDLVGAVEPDSTELVAEINTVIADGDTEEPEADIEIYFSERRLLETTSSTTQP